MKLTREVKTGILVIVGILLFIFGYSFLQNSRLFSNPKTFYVKYPNVAGLANSAPVTINGLQVGKVLDIVFQNKQGDLLVSFSVEKDFNFSKNSVVEIYSSGFIGGNNLAIIPGTDYGNTAQTGDTLSGKIQAGMIDGIMDKFGPLENSLLETLAKLDTVLTGVSDILDDKSRKNLRSTIANLNTTMANFSGASRDLNSLLGDNKVKLSSTFENLDKTSQNFAKLSDSLAQINTGEMVRNMEEAIGKLNNIAEGLENGEGSMGKLLKDEAMYDNLTGASKQLEQLLEDMKLNPKRYVHFSLFGKRAKPYEPSKDTVQ